MLIQRCSGSCCPMKATRSSFWWRTTAAASSTRPSPQASAFSACRNTPAMWAPCWKFAALGNPALVSPSGPCSSRKNSAPAFFQKQNRGCGEFSDSRLQNSRPDDTRAASLAHSNQTSLNGVRDRAGPVGCSELHKAAGDMVADGFVAYEKSLCYLFVAQALGNQRKHLQF